MLTDEDPEESAAALAADEGDASDDRFDPGPYVADDEDFVSAYAAAPSPPHSFQGTKPIAKPLAIQKEPFFTPRRTPIHGRPIILRDLKKHSSSLTSLRRKPPFSSAP